MESTFNPDASAKDLGVHRFVTGWIQCGPGADAPWPSHNIRLVHEFDPKFRLMWVVNVWKTPNDGIVKTGNYMLARQVVNPTATGDWIKNPRLPIGSVHGVSYRGPFLAASILDARTSSEMQHGVIPKFKPFTGREVETMRAAMWLRNNKSLDEREREASEAEAEAEKRAERTMHKEAIYRRQYDGVQLRKLVGKADRVYVSESLRKLREVAGVKVEAA